MKEQHFHDIVSILVTTLSAFIAGLAANIAAIYFEKKCLSEKEAETIAQDAADVKRNEIQSWDGASGACEVQLRREFLESRQIMGILPSSDKIIVSGPSHKLKGKSMEQVLSPSFCDIQMSDIVPDLLFRFLVYLPKLSHHLYLFRAH